MKKSNFVALVLGTIGGVFFALGMCMALLPEWNMQTQGIVCGVIGLVILLITLGIWRKMEGKAPVKLSGKTTIDPVTGVEKVVKMESITNTWQVVEAVDGEDSGMSADIMSMCNINLLFFMAAVLVCLFVTDDFRSGYAKNLFAVRSKKTDYVVFISVYLLWSVVGKQKLWLSLIGSFGIGMLFFMMIPSLTPLNSGIINVIMCLIGGMIFSVGLGAASNQVLQKTSLV